jgi:hypothetical protein
VGGGPLRPPPPVIYSPGREVTSAVVEFRSPGSGRWPGSPSWGRRPSWPSSPKSPALLAPWPGIRPLPTAGDELRVVSSRYADGGLLPGLPIPLAGGLHVDLVPPASATFASHVPPVRGMLPPELGGIGLPLRLGLGEVEDEGVGGARATFHVGEAGLTDEEVAERPALSAGGNFPRRRGTRPTGPWRSSPMRWRIGGWSPGTLRRESPGEHPGSGLRRGPHTADGDAGPRWRGAWGHRHQSPRRRAAGSWWPRPGESGLGPARPG